MSNFDDFPMILFIKNEKGIAMPVYAHSDDLVELIWNECAYSSAINGKTLKGKALFFQDTILERKKRISDYQISRGSIITLKEINA